jgi:hypothetical protein
MPLNLWRLRSIVGLKCLFPQFRAFRFIQRNFQRLLYRLSHTTAAHDNFLPFHTGTEVFWRQAGTSRCPLFRIVSPSICMNMWRILWDVYLRSLQLTWPLASATKSQDVVLQKPYIPFFKATAFSLSKRCGTLFASVSWYARRPTPFLLFPRTFLRMKYFTLIHP